ncbi:MAG: hypothetical protein ABIO86_21860 [Sphingomonas sp.]
MIQQLVQRLIEDPTWLPGVTDSVKRREAVAKTVLTADPLDLTLYIEQLWDKADTPLDTIQNELSGARENLYLSGVFANYVPSNASQHFPPWDHLIYAYVIESTRAVQILGRVVREYRSGEALGIASQETRRWVEATEALLFGAANPLAAWLSTSNIRPDAEAVRRNAYWRLFGLDLGFGREDNSAPAYAKAQAANATFTALFEELLFELWQAISNLNNKSGVNQSDDDRIYRIAEQLRFVLTSRRQNDMLRREELSAVTALGWAELTVSYDTSVVRDLGAEATNLGDRLKIIGERVGLAAHSRSAAFFSMSEEISLLLRAIEAGLVTGPSMAWLLYATEPAFTTADGLRVGPFGAESRRVITEWAAATGKDLKVRGKPVETSRPRLVAVR